MEESKQQDKNQSGYKSRAWLSMAASWDLTSDWWQSPLDILKQEDKYLEKFRNEPVLKYQYRLRNSVPVNEFRSTIETMAGVVFKSDPKPTETETSIQDLFSDIDLQGNSFWQWNLDGLQKYLRDGNAHIFIEAPAFVPGEARPTLQDRAGDRPWWILYEAKQIINEQWIEVGGRSVRSQVTIEVRSIEADGLYGETEVIRHKVYRRGEGQTRGTYQIFKQVEINGKMEFVDDPDNPPGQLATTEIPLVSVASATNPPPLIVLAMLNRLHYNKTSDFDDWCHVACVPERIYNCASKSDATEFIETSKTISPGMGRTMWGEHAKAYFNEVSGKGLEIAERRYKDIEQQMARIGVGLFAPSAVAPRSATEVMDTAGQRQSQLAKYARDWENSVEKALYITGEIINAIKPNSVNLSRQEDSKLKLRIDYDRLIFDPQELKLLSELVDKGQLSLPTFLKRLWMLIDMPENTTAEDELAAVARVTAPVAIQTNGNG